MAVVERTPEGQSSDGRTRRGARNREAIIGALIACYHDALLAPSVPEVADRALRNQINRGFPEMSSDTLDAVDALTSWDTWNRLRAAQGLSVARAKRVLVRTVRMLLEEEL